MRDPLALCLALKKEFGVEKKSSHGGQK